MMAMSQENAPNSDGGSAGGSADAEGGGRRRRRRRRRRAARAARVPGKIYAREADLEKATQPDTQAPWPAHGFLAKAKVDREHWITVGVPETVYALVSGSAIYTPIKVDRGVNAVVYAGADQVMASGYSWDEFRKQLAYQAVPDRATRRPRQRDRLHRRPQLSRLYGWAESAVHQRRLSRRGPRRRRRRNGGRGAVGHGGLLLPSLEHARATAVSLSERHVMVA